MIACEKWYGKSRASTVIVVYHTNYALHCCCVPNYILRANTISITINNHRQHVIANGFDEFS